jgi:hypothetical protein
MVLYSSFDFILVKKNAENRMSKPAAARAGDEGGGISPSAF